MKDYEVVMVSLDEREAGYYLCFITFAVANMLPDGNGTVTIKILDNEHNKITRSQLASETSYLVKLLGR